MNDLHLILALLTAPLYYPVILLFTPRKRLHQLIHSEEEISYLNATRLLEVAEDWHQRRFPHLRSRMEAIGREIHFTPRTQQQKQAQIEEVLHAAMYANFPSRRQPFFQASLLQQVVFVIGILMGPATMGFITYEMASRPNNELSEIAQHLSEADYFHFGLDVITILFMVLGIGYIMSLVYLSIYQFYLTVLCLFTSFLPGNQQALFVFQDLWDQMIIMIWPFRQFNRISHT